MNDARDALRAINRNTDEWRAKVIVAAERDLPSEWGSWIAVEVIRRLLVTDGEETATAIVVALPVAAVAAIQDRLNRENPDGVRRYLSSEGREIVEEIIMSAWAAEST